MGASSLHATGEHNTGARRAAKPAVTSRTVVSSMPSPCCSVATLSEKQHNHDDDNHTGKRTIRMFSGDVDNDTAD